MLCGLAAPVASLSAQQSDGYQAYALRHAQAEQVEGALAPLVPAGTEIVADRKGNRILIRGSAAAQEIAQRVVDSLDKAQSGSAASLTPIGAESVLRVYSCAPGKPSVVTESLQDEFGRRPGVRIVADQRTSQVLVLAPPEVQAMVTARLGDAAREASPAQASQPAPQPTPVPPSTPSAPSEQASASAYLQQIELKHATAASLESLLASIFGERLVPVGAQVPGTESYRLRLNDGGEVAFTVDRGANRLTYTAAGAAAGAFPQLIRALDSPEQAVDQATRLVPLKTTRAADAQRTVEAIRITSAGRERSIPANQSDSPRASTKLPLAARMFQPGRRTVAQVVAAADAQAAPAPAAAAQPNAAPPGPGVGAAGVAPGTQPRGEEGGGLIGPVQIEMLEGLDVLVIRGNARDVKQVVDIIQQIEKLSIETEPAIEVYQLNHVDCSAMSTLVTQLYSQVYVARQGTVTILPLVKPNALLLVGRKENVERAGSLVKLLDVPVKPDTEFQVFRLKHAPAANAQAMIEEFYADPTGLSPVVRVNSDVRSNSLIVHASPRDLAEVAAMIARIDTDEIEAVNELRVFQLTNTLAADLAQTLTDAIQSQATAQGQLGARTGASAAARTAATAGMPGAAGRTTQELRSSMLQFVTVDTQGQRRLSSGILTDVRITYDARANTVIVAAPAKSMPLIEALVNQLDKPPAVRAEVKVFTVVNSDASALVTMLTDFFGQPTTGTTGGGAFGGAAGAAGGPNYQTAAREGESSLVPLRFVADARTNSIIASGTAGDLLVVEAMLLRLDGSDVRNRVSTVYRLKNAPATDVATAINSFLRAELQAINLQTGAGGGGLLSPFEQIERQVVVVAEPVSNSLIVAATPRYFEEIKKIVEDLDRRPPMVLIQCLIAEVDITNDDQFGVELGLQDGLLFNRGAPPNPGFLFNSPTLGNDGTTTALEQAANVGTQGLTNFGLGRTTSRGFGGLVMSASSESVSVLIRALKSRERIDILAKPQIQTLDNQTAYINVGASVAQIMGVTNSTFGQTNSIQYTNTGIIMGVTPRISPDGIVVMEIDAQRSELGPEAEGTPIFVSSTGQVIRAPQVKQTLAQTTVSATDGQTVVLGGLISKQISDTHRSVPYLSDVPVLGHLFRFDAKNVVKKELLIIMTPHVVRTEEDAESVKRVEAARMHWCLADVIEIMGESGLRGRKDDWPDGQTKVIYPDGDPRTLRDPSSVPPGRVPMPPSDASEAIPSPGPTPFRLEPSGARQGKTPTIRNGR